MTSRTLSSCSVLVARSGEAAGVEDGAVEVEPHPAEQEQDGAHRDQRLREPRPTSHRSSCNRTDGRSHAAQSQVISYLSEIRSYASGSAVPSRSAAASSRKKPSKPAGEIRTSSRPVRGTRRLCA